MLLIESCSTNLFEALNAVITVADLHAVASTVLLVPSGATSVSMIAGSTSGLASAFARAQLVVPRYTIIVGTSQTVVVLARLTWSIILAAQDR